ncbi:helix-turn-helix domain-containing protein [Tumebacillus flagellatus]|uniref:HTH cro/C1-type domain-containing protein n=1 Tax=Tumebacillus flagellatus TaxID=1157490 RepID=A0A074M6I2_9BACL|nr:helix-turn-helix domain-containing protein [Tumebacillus flagellatus]KEO81587.1 hypothetical protein EL26_20090 [Tumebacillus flagellatus]
MTSLGEKIKLCREARGFTQRELAERADVSPATVSAVENGRFVPTPDVVHRIAAELGLPFYELAELIPSPKLDTLLEIATVYLSNRDNVRALQTLHRAQTEHPTMLEYQRDELTMIEANCLIYFPESRMQGIETFYALSRKLEGNAHTDLRLAFRVQNGLGAAWYLHQDFVTALHHYARALEILKSLPEPGHKLLATAHYNTGDCLRWLGRDHEAILHLQQAIEPLTKLRNFFMLGSCYFSLGVSYKNLGLMPQAVQAFRNAVPLMQQAKSKLFEMRCRSYVAFFDPEQTDDAVAVFEQELRELEDTLTPQYRGLVHTRMAKVHLDRGDLEQAQAALEKAEGLLSGLPPRGEHAYFLLNCALYHMAREDYDAASRYAFEATDLYASLRFFLAELQESLRIGKEAVFRMRQEVTS